MSTYVDEVQVCLVHGKMFSCRLPDLGNCEWTSDPDAVNVVRAYQQRGRSHWQYTVWPSPGWEPGDTCGVCKSTNTYGGAGYAGCYNCGASDADE